MKSSTLMLIVGVGAAYLLLSGRGATAAPSGAQSVVNPVQMTGPTDSKWDVIGQGVNIIGDIFKDLLGTDEAKTANSAVGWL